MIEDKSFVFHYIPLKAAANRLETSTDRLILECMKCTIGLYFVNQSSKTLHYAPLNYENGWGRLKNALKIGYKWHDYSKGEMLELVTIRQLDLLAKGILTEKDALLLHPDGDHWLAYRFTPLLQFIHVNYRTNKFYPVTLDHVFMLRSELEPLKAALEAPKQLDDGESELSDPDALTQQDRREIIFAQWIEESKMTREEISNMKRADVWESLRQIDCRLFNANMENFFRDQAIMKFKPGRKPKTIN
jgi:hypothetical protein